MFGNLLNRGRGGAENVHPLQTKTLVRVVEKQVWQHKQFCQNTP